MSEAPEPTDAAGPVDVDALRDRLLAWYDDHARDLPWRRTDDPYAVWVSEIMLQQTRVETVVPYYERWMETYPSVEALAAADLDDVLKGWEGLGYYRRARMLHRAAGVVRDRHGGALPEDADGLRELPGVGAYTAGAVASIAFGRAVPAVDGNVRRVLARLHDLPDPTPAEVRDRVARLVDPDRPGDFNQALMELGATVCTPRAPACDACPLDRLCSAHALGVEEERPTPRARGRVPERRFGVAVPWRPSGAEPELLLRRRPESGMLGGLWDFPAARLDDDEDPGAVALRVAREAGAEVDESARPRELGQVRHAYSHFRGVYVPFLVKASSGGAPRKDTRWASIADAGELPLPVAQREILGVAEEALDGAPPDTDARTVEVT